MRRYLLLAAGLCLAASALATPLQTAPPGPGHPVAVGPLAPRAPRLAPSAPCEVVPCPSTVRYYPPRRAYRPHIEVVERTYVVVEDSTPALPPLRFKGRRH